MNKVVVSALLGLVGASCATDELSTVSSEVAGGRRYVVVFRSEALPKDAAKKIASAGGRVLRSLPSMGIALVSGNETFANKLGADPAVAALGGEHYFVASDDEPVLSPLPITDWFVDLQWDMRRIGAPALWERDIPASRVAVIDSGVMRDHVDLLGTVTFGMTTSYCADLAGDTYGYPSYDGIADLNVLDCVANDPAARFPFEAFHGTHVAGTVAAPANTIGVVGVSPTTKIHAYKVFDIIREGDAHFFGAFDFPIFAAIDDAVAKGTKVINMSLGGVLDRSTRDGNAAWIAWSRVASVAYRKGTLIVAAAGNDASDNNGTLAFIPSDLSSVLSVSSTGTNQWVGEPVIDETSFSNFTAAPGSDVPAFYTNVGAAVDISAPGGDCGPAMDCWSFSTVPHQILSTCVFPELDETGWPTGNPSTEWCWAMGTSMAAPHVAGVAAAVRALHPTFNAGDTRSWLKSTATPVGPRQQYGAGIVNADLATR